MSRSVRVGIAAGAALSLAAVGLTASASAASAAGGNAPRLALAGLAAARSSAVAGWAKARNVPGLAVLNQGGSAGISSVSCALAGNCTAGGSYRDSSGIYHAFVATQTSGTWGKATNVPGLAALSNESAGVNWVSCASAGNCPAVGNDAGSSQVFVTRQVHGTWGKAIGLPGVAAGEVDVRSLSCASAGSCSIGGDYLDRSGHFQAFVASEAHGAWGKSIEVPGTAALNTGGDARVYSVSCASAGNCTAGGQYTSSGDFQTFVASQTGGTWGKATNLPGTAVTGPDNAAGVGAVSCTSAGNCTGGGFRNSDAFVARQSGDMWGKATGLPGAAALGVSAVEVMSCPSAGNCSAGGFDSIDGLSGFVATETSGTWGKAIEVPGLVALNGGGDAGISSLSCAAAGTCSAGGFYTDGPGATQAFVVSETGGTWGKAIEVPGTAALNTSGGAQVNSVSCAAAGSCTAGGYYTASPGHSTAFVVSKTPPVPGHVR